MSAWICIKNRFAVWPPSARMVWVDPRRLPDASMASYDIPDLVRGRFERGADEVCACCAPR